MGQGLWTCWGGSIFLPPLVWVGEVDVVELCFFMKKRQKVLENRCSCTGGQVARIGWQLLPCCARGHAAVLSGDQPHSPAWLSVEKQRPARYKDDSTRQGLGRHVAALFLGVGCGSEQD